MLVTKIVFFTFLATVLFLPILNTVANSIGLVDRPTNRKRHEGSVPLVGGVAMYLVTIGFSWHFLSSATLVLLSAVLLPLVVIGFIDDFGHVKPSLRLLVQMAVAIAMIFCLDVRIVEIGNLFGRGSVTLPYWVSFGFTVFCYIGVINAVNMIDGLDGLAGSLVLFTLVALVFTARPDGDVLLLTLILFGCITAFLLFNLQILGARQRVFLGDAGSMFLGVVLVWVFISLSQSSEDGIASLSPVAAGWLLGLPLVDAVSVMVGRIRCGLNPVAPGRDHAHHLLLDSGISPRITLCILAGVHLTLLAIGLLVNTYLVLEALGFWLFVALVVCFHFLVPEFIKMYQKRGNLAVTS